MNTANYTPLLIQMHERDNVAVVGNAGGLNAGTVIASPHITLKDKVPQAHKVALVDLPKGAVVLRYGVPIGYANRDIAAGQWVHERLLDMPAARELQGLPLATIPAPNTLARFSSERVTALKSLTFMGFKNKDGSVGTRNLLAITTTVQCVAGVLAFAVDQIKQDLLPLYPNVDDVVGLEHTYGCGVAIDAPDAVIPIRTVRNISLNPNFGGEVMVLSLGCEKLQPDRLFPTGSIQIADASQAIPNEAFGHVCLQAPENMGFGGMINSILKQARVHLERLNQRRREPVPLSELVVGVQCGGSDALSGVTANPAVGLVSDLLVAAGGTLMFSENTEVRDAVEQLTSRAATPEVANDIIKELAWYDDYLARGRVDRSANTTPGNKAGGLSNIAEKAMGSVIKSGASAISSVLTLGEKLKPNQRGLIYTATPASDFICGTLQLAAGMNLHIFTTGRGTPYGLAACPVVKVATRSELAARWFDLMDVNAGRVADGELTLEDLAWEMLQLLIAVASGQKTWAEKHKLANALVLFNPAPIT